jgi:hypothetical protein
MYVQTIVGNGVITVLPNDCAHPSCLVLPVVENLKVKFWISLKWHNIHNKFNENPFSPSKVIMCIQRDITGDKHHQD